MTWEDVRVGEVYGWGDDYKTIQFFVTELFDTLIPDDNDPDILWCGKVKRYYSFMPNAVWDLRLSVRDCAFLRSLDHIFYE